MNKNLKYILSLCALAAHTLLYAQDVAQYRFDDATQLWRLTDNAAALGIDSSRTRGIALIDVKHADGDYRRVQEGGQQNQLQFFTERYQPIGRFLYGYGRFLFGMDRTKDRAWSDVMRTYDSNPFFPGSSISARYDTQCFDLTAAVGTIEAFGWRGGMRIDYQVADLSRLRDPRSRSELLDYTITPSLTYHTGSHIFGLSGHYNRRKEKIPSITTVQEDPNLSYYQMTGLEQATGIVGGYKGFNREWVRHTFGAALSYNLRQGKALNSLTTLTISRGGEDIWGTYKYHPGQYVDYHYGIDSKNRLQRRSVLHEIDLNVAYEEAYADEYRQQLLQERDEQGFSSYRYETQIAFDKRFQLKRTEAALHYRLSALQQPDGQQASSPAVKAYVGVDGSYHHSSQKHLLPTSEQTLAAYDISADGGVALLRNKRLWAELSAGYHHPTKASLQLSDPTTLYATSVLIPDMQYYDADFWRGHAQLTYQFPLRLKQKIAQWFVRAYYDHTSAQHALNRQSVGLSVGILSSE